LLTIRRVLTAIPVALVVVIAAGVAGWWLFVREDAKLATTAPEIPSDLQTPADTAGEPPSDVQAFRIIPERSEAAYFADEKLARLPLPSKAKGATNEIEGTFYLTEDGAALAPEPLSRFTVNVASITSDEAMRDNRMRGALEVDRFPTATFVASSVTGYDPSISEGQEQSLKLTGTLELHGVQREVTWDVKARRDGDVFTALATLSMRFDDFNIPVPNIAGFVSVEEDVTLQVQIVAQRA